MSGHIRDTSPRTMVLKVRLILRRGDPGGLRYAMLPEGLGCALHDKEAAVLELDRDRTAATFAFVSKGKFPFSAKAERANHGIFPERLFVVAVPAQAFAAVTVQIAET